MNTEATRTITVNVSASNLLSQLYSLGVLKDSEEVQKVSFDNSVLGKNLDKNKQWTPEEVVPITLTIKEVHTLN